MTIIVLLIAPCIVVNILVPLATGGNTSKCVRAMFMIMPAPTPNPPAIKPPANPIKNSRTKFEEVTEKSPFTNG